MADKATTKSVTQADIIAHEASQARMYTKRFRRARKFCEYWRHDKEWDQMSCFHNYECPGICSPLVCPLVK